MSADRSVQPPAETTNTIVLLSIDSLRLDRLYGERNGTPIMPDAAAFAEQSLEFRTGISPGPSTADSVPAMLTGAFPSQFPGFALPPADSEPRTIAEQLSEFGFTTAAFHQNNLISRRYNFDRGFDHYYDISEETREETGRGTWRLRVRNLIGSTPLMKIAGWIQQQAMTRLGKSLYVLDEPGNSLTDRAILWLEENPRNRFLWMHYMDAHHPYIAPPDVQSVFGRKIPKQRLLKLSKRARTDSEQLSDADIADLKYAYDAAVRFVDEQLGRIIEYLEEAGEFADAMIVLTADHGEELMERGSLGHRSSQWDELITVPLIVRHPDLDPATVEGQAPVRALPETILDGSGLFTHQDGGVEYAVAETKEGRDGVRCSRGRKFKLIVDDDERTVTRVDGDGEQIVEESAVPADVIEELEAELDEDHDVYGETEQLDEESLREDLAALGYLDE